MQVYIKIQLLIFVELRTSKEKRDTPQCIIKAYKFSNTLLLGSIPPRKALPPLVDGQHAILSSLMNRNEWLKTRSIQWRNSPLSAANCRSGVQTQMSGLANSHLLTFLCFKTSLAILLSLPVLYFSWVGIQAPVIQHITPYLSQSSADTFFLPKENRALTLTVIAELPDSLLLADFPTQKVFITPWPVKVFPNWEQETCLKPGNSLLCYTTIIVQSLNCSQKNKPNKPLTNKHQNQTNTHKRTHRTQLPNPLQPHEIKQ